MSTKASSLLLYLVLILITSCYALETLIQLPAGKIQGREQQSREGRKIASFEGVPYAAKPERWLPPQPVAPWDITLDCSKPGPMCLQTDIMTDTMNTTIGSEDCLTMNIFTTNTSTAANLPVIDFLIAGTGWYYG